MGKRPETGPMKFQGDWAGLFIRGDSAAWYRYNLESLLSYLDKDDSDQLKPYIYQLKSLIDLLSRADERGLSPRGKQMMKGFEKVSKSDSEQDEFTFSSQDMKLFAESLDDTIHYCYWGGQPDIYIGCDNGCLGPAWKQPKYLAEGIYLLEDGRYYCFEKSMATCKACLEKYPKG